MRVSRSDLARKRADARGAKISSAASSGAADSTGGLLSCQPAAPARGSNAPPMRKRVAGSLAPPARQPRQRMASRACRSCTKAPPIAPGPAVQVLVAAPGGEIRAAVVQRERQVADRSARGRSPRCAPARVRGARDAREVEGLAGAVLHAGPQHQRQRVALGGDARPRCPRGAAAPRRRAARASISAVGGVVAVPAQLRADHVAVGRERAGLDQDAMARARSAGRSSPAAGAG